MNAMIEILESRTLLSAAPVTVSFAPMQGEMSAALTVLASTSPVGTYTGTHASTRGYGGAGFTVIIRKWNTAAGIMKFTLTDKDGSIKSAGTISGRNFTLQIHSTKDTTTLTGKVAKNFASMTGTYVNRKLSGVVKDKGTFAASR